MTLQTTKKAEILKHLICFLMMIFFISGFSIFSGCSSSGGGSTTTTTTDSNTDDVVEGEQTGIIYVDTDNASGTLITIHLS